MSDSAREVIPEEIRETIDRIDKELQALNEVEIDTDGDTYRYMRLIDQRHRIILYSKEKEALKSRGISFQEIDGGFIIQSPKLSNRRFYYYSNSGKWRQEGKSKYYRCKDVNDLLDRFVLDTSFKDKPAPKKTKGKKND
jgi:hypothetical protein